MLNHREDFLKWVEYSNLDTYDVFGCNIHRCEDSAKIKQLILHRNSITMIPESIQWLSHLEEIRITENKIKQLPKSLFESKNIKEVIISEKFLHKIPSLKGCANSLKKLSIYQCLNLNDLPNDIEELENIERLFLHKNKKNIDLTKIEKLSSLKELHLSALELDNLDFDFSSFFELKFLSLIHNNLTELSTNFTLFTSSLEELHLWNNKLKNLPENMEYLENLKRIDLLHNKLESIPDSLSKIKSLEEITIGNFDFSFFTTRKLKKIYGSKLKIVD